MSFLNDYFEDKENGGLFHAMSEDWSKTVSTEKRGDEQFSSARTSVIGAMITHDPEDIRDAELAVNDVMSRFEDRLHGGYFMAADKDWRICKKEKSLRESGELLSVLMHLYEVSKNDAYLLKALDFLDICLNQARDKENGGFFSLYHDNWKPAVDTKDLATQSAMLQHINASWKDGMDSPFGARSALHKKKAEEFGDMLLDKATDKVHGGFYTLFKKDWAPAETGKDVGALASFAINLYFHYHNMGQSIWGPRKGSHAYTGRPYPAAYSYRGPAPGIDPVSDRAYRFGKTVMDIADILLQKAWDDDHGGFYTCLTETLQPKYRTKLISTQMSCLLALNAAYRLTGLKRFQKKLAEAMAILENKCFDPDNSGVYSSFERDWKPALRDKECGPNLMVMGIMSMMAPVVNDLAVTGKALGIWIDPPVREIVMNSQAGFTVTVQNLGFESCRVRVGGLTAPSRWMEPGDIVFELAPHEVKSYPLTITPPKDMPQGYYPFEITCFPEGTVWDYVPVGGKVIIR